ncbi:MAG: chalcone isomerase family protein [Proteobacteria bacterium]|nr:chalcone isomerase family protein [Pseudomonadota bacterium]
MMIKRLLCVMMFSLLAASMSYAAVVDGVDVPEKLAVGDTELLLNGAGMREKRLGPINKDIYVASLYLTTKTSDPKTIIDADETMMLRIKIVTSLITSEKFINHTKEGFIEATKGNTAPIQKEIDAFLSAFADDIKDGDLFEILYTKGVGVQVFKNGSKEAKIMIPGIAVKPALFGIWLGDRTEKNLQSLAKNLLSSPEIKK